jgi:ATP-dependent protease ClpP protease subunit
MQPNELVLYGTVGVSFWGEDYFTAKEVRDNLASMRGDITVRINSGGGVATEGQAIYTALRDYPGSVTVVVDSVAASAASLIAMSGDEIIMRRGAWMLIHDPATPYTAGRGTEDDHLKEAELLGVMSDAYAEVYAARAGISRDEARAIMREETILSGEKAVAMGFATSTEDAEAEPAATFDYRMYAHAPQKLRAASESLGLAPEPEAILAMIAGVPRQHKEIAMSAKPDTAAEVISADDEKGVVGQPEAPATDPKAARAESAQAALMKHERQRVRRILDATAAAGLPSDFATGLIDEGASLEAALDKITAAWKEKGDADVPMKGRPTATILRDERDTRRTAMASALTAQLGRCEPDHGSARPYMSMSLVEMAATAADYRGPMRTPYDRLQAVEAAFHSTSDFPSVLENALNKRLLDTYAKAAPTYREISMRMDFNDFRPHPVSAMGDIPLLQEIPEGGRIQYGTTSDKKESLSLRPYGIALQVTRQTLINDDLGAIDRLLADRANTVATTEEQAFWQGMFLSGANADGPTLLETGRQAFNTNAADNTKAASGAAITIASLTAARAALRQRRGLPSAAGRTDGQFLNLPAAILLVGPLKETEAQQILSPIQAQQAGNVNPFPGTMRVVVTPYITDNSWYVFADPMRTANFAYGYLRGAAGPRVTTDTPFDSQGVWFKVESDFGCGATDFRGGWKNPGA